MDVQQLIEGIIVGLTIAAPVGPMGVLCMRRTLTRGWMSGIATGLGIATGDGIYACIAALGLTGVSHVLIAYSKPFHYAAGLVVLYLGIRAFPPHPAPDRVPERNSTQSSYASAVLLTLTNLPTIISFAAVLTVIAPPSGFTTFGSALTILGIFLGSTLWWLVLATSVKVAHHVVGQRIRLWIDITSGVALIAFGIVEMAQG